MTAPASALSGLACARCGEGVDADRLQTICRCGGTLFARYDFERARRTLTAAALRDRPPGLWRWGRDPPRARPRTSARPRRGGHPARFRAATRRAARPVPPPPQRRGAQSGRIVQGTGHGGSGRTGRGAWSAALRAPQRRQRRRSRRRLWRNVGGRRSTWPFLSKPRSRSATRSAFTEDSPRRRRGHRRRGSLALRVPGSRGLVLPLDAQGALSRGGEEDDGARAGRAARVALARRW